MKNKLQGLKKTTRVDFATYLGVILAFLLVTVLRDGGMLKKAHIGMLIPICAYIVMAISLNLTVGVLGELSLGHAGFMSVGAFSGVIAAQSLQTAIPSAPVRLAVAILVGAAFASVAGVIVGVPVLRLRGDYLAIVTLAFGEIIKDLINCLLVGYDSRGLHMAFNLTGSLTINDIGMEPDGVAIIKGAQGATGTATISSFTAGFVLIMISLVIILNLVRSRAGRAIMALRDNRIAAESVGINVTKYKMMAFVTSAALAGAAGALYGLNYSNLAASKFSFDTSILVLVYVVLGGLGNMWGSIIAAAILYILPEALRQFSDFRMLVYAIVLILVMLVTNNPTIKNSLDKFKSLCNPTQNHSSDEFKMLRNPSENRSRGYLGMVGCIIVLIGLFMPYMKINVFGVDSMSFSFFAFVWHNAMVFSIALIGILTLMSILSYCYYDFIAAAFALIGIVIFIVVTFIVGDSSLLYNMFGLLGSGFWVIIIGLVVVIASPLLNIVNRKMEKVLNRVLSTEDKGGKQ